MYLYLDQKDRVVLKCRPDNYECNYNSNDQKKPSIFNDLIMLRTAAAREIKGAVYHYFVASRETLNELFTDGMTYQEYFAHEAADEMVHYLNEIRTISAFDTVQRQEFINHGLEPYLVDDVYPPINFWYGPFTYPASEREARWLKTIEHVILSIEFELATIDIYQKFIRKAYSPEVKCVFTEAMNHEKGDLADFNQMLFALLATT